MEKKEITFLMDEKRNLFIRDADGVEYNFWALGWGIPVSLVVETEAEREQKNLEEKENRRKEHESWLKREAERQPWYKKLFTQSNDGTPAPKKIKV